MQKKLSPNARVPPPRRDPELQQRLSEPGGSPLKETDPGQERDGAAGEARAKRRMLVGLDLMCLFVVSIPFFACELKAVTPYHRGFFCGDPSITYPHLKTESIPDSLLIGGGIAITGLAIALGECYRVRFCDVYSRAFVRNLYVSSLYKELGSFLFGCCVGQSLTNIAKLSVGRLRPHFLSLCNVTYASLNCMLGTYVPSVVCRLTDPREVEEARKSFFSGHASFAMYTMLYLTKGVNEPNASRVTGNSGTGAPLTLEILGTGNVTEGHAVTSGTSGRERGSRSVSEEIPKPGAVSRSAFPTVSDTRFTRSLIHAPPTAWKHVATVTASSTCRPGSPGEGHGCCGLSSSSSWSCWPCTRA
ncbi:phospholipid phosphatase 3-like isoform X1 [Scleropages formosus]|uniref:phospholipid phosphatase 3-like isoform X1 n=1 Tax=Scleropages formosus TaxID=113540 RepID=UPI0010FA8590|nr:phospholipid phosphatase 3-like isoform X1 [Scleropages formosus]